MASAAIDQSEQPKTDALPANDALPVKCARRTAYRRLSDFGALTKAEERLLAGCYKGEQAVCGEQLADPGDEEKRVRAEFVRFLALGGDEDAPVHERGVTLRGAWIDGVLALQSARLERQIDLEMCWLQKIEASWAIVPSLAFDGCRIAEGFVGDGLTCTGGIFLRMGAYVTGEVRLVSATLSGGLWLEGGTFENKGGAAILCEGMTIGGPVRMSQCDSVMADVSTTFLFRADGVVSFMSSRIAGAVDCQHGSFNNPDGVALNLSGTQIGGDLMLSEGFRATGQVAIGRTKVGASLDCRGGTFSHSNDAALLCESACIEREFIFRNVRTTGSINVWHMKVGVLVDDVESWRRASGQLILDGFQYGSFFDPGGAAGLVALATQPPTDAATRIAWLRMQEERYLRADFRPQPWEQLIATLRGMGHPNAAREVAVAKEEALAASGRARNWRRRPVRALFHLLYGKLAGYGYKMDNFFYNICAIVAVFALIYYAGTAHQNCAYCIKTTVFVPAKAASDVIAAAPMPEVSPPSAPDPVLLSLDTILPIDLGYTSTWKTVDTTAGHFFCWAIVIETIIGWLCAGLLISALGNLVKRD